MDDGEVSDSGTRVVIKRFRRRTGTRLLVADSQDECVSASAEPTLQAPAVSAQDVSTLVCPETSTRHALQTPSQERPHGRKARRA